MRGVHEPTPSLREKPGSAGVSPATEERGRRDACAHGARLRQAERGLADHRHNHRLQEQPPDLLHQCPGASRAIVHAGEVQPLEKPGHAIVVQHRRLVLGDGTIDGQQPVARLVNSGAERVIGRKSALGAGQALPGLRAGMPARGGRPAIRLRVLPRTGRSRGHGPLHGGVKNDGVGRQRGVGRGRRRRQK